MPDDKTNVGEPDRSRVSADQDYEVSQLAEKHGLSPTQIRELIACVAPHSRRTRLSSWLVQRWAQVSFPLRRDGTAT